MSLRELRAAAVALAAAAGLAGCGGSAAPSSNTKPHDRPAARSRSRRAVAAVHSRSSVAPSADPREPARRAPATARSPRLRHLQAVVGRALADVGPDVGVQVQDLDTGRILFSRNAAVARPPASVEKLYTSVASLQMLGPGARFDTTLLGTGGLRPGGVWRGDLYLRGGGDPTFGDGSFNATYEDGYGPTAAQLVAQLRRRGIRRLAGSLFADESLFDSDRGGPFTDDKPDIPDYGGQLSALVYDHGSAPRGFNPATFAASEVALTARGQGVGVFASRRAARTPAGAKVLATVASPPLKVLLKLMDVPSDDLIADLLDKQIGHRFFGAGTLRAGAIEIGQDIATHFGIKPVILDGSGLDHDDRTTPEQVVTLLAKLWRTPLAAEVRAALPVVGETGTVRGIAVDTPAQGHCQAKTGTLTDVSNLAGWCTAAGGHTLAFAVMVDGPSNWQAFVSIAKMVAAIAAY